MNLIKLFFLSTFCITAQAMQRSHGDLIEAVRANNVEMLKQLIDAGVYDLNYQDEYGNTALIQTVVSRGHTICLQPLLQAGARTDLQNKDGWTALMMAAFSGYQKCCHLLLDRMMQLPTNAQKQKLYTFLWCMKQYGLDHNMRRYIKPYLLAAIEEENYEHPEQSFAWQEVDQQVQYSIIFFSRRQPLFDYLKRKQPKENKSGWFPISGWCPIL